MASLILVTAGVLFIFWRFPRAVTFLLLSPFILVAIGFFAFIYLTGYAMIQDLATKEDRDAAWVQEQTELLGYNPCDNRADFWVSPSDDLTHEERSERADYYNQLIGHCPPEKSYP